MNEHSMSVLDELLLKKDMSYEELFNNYTYTTPISRPRRNRLKLSPEAAKLVSGAYTYLTGMQLHVNRYYLAESMTETICAAEALNL